MAKLICSFSNPKTFPGIPNPTLPTHHWQYASSTCDFVGVVSTTQTISSIYIATDTLPITTNGFTLGELVNSVWLFLIFMAILGFGVFTFLAKQKIKL